MLLRMQYLEKLLMSALLTYGFAGALASPAQTLPVTPELPGWLRYGIPPDPPRYHDMPHAVVLLAPAGQESPSELAAADELDRGLGHMVAGTDLLLHRFDLRLDSIVLGTTEELHRTKALRNIPGWTEAQLPADGFRIVHLRRGVRQWWILQGNSPRAELYAAFRFAALVAEDQQLPNELIEMPRLSLRAVEWQGEPSGILPFLERKPADSTTGGLSRMLASVGINAILLGGSGQEAAHIASVVQPYGVKLWLRPDAAMRNDPRQIDTLASSISNFGGVVLSIAAKASAADLQQINAVARALQHRGASVLLEDALGPPLQSAAVAATDSPEQRASALLGALEPNVIVSGPLASPLIPWAGLGSANFGLLPGVAQAASMDLLPPKKTVVFPLAAWQHALTTPERGVKSNVTLLGALQAEPPHAPSAGGAIAILRTGDIERLMHQPLLQANLYAFGRMAWNPDESDDTVADEWARQTWGDDARIFGVAKHIVVGSLGSFLAQTSPMGLPDVSGAAGGPDPERASLRNGVSGVPLADAKGIGVDRTAAGTNEISRYPATFAETLADPDRCPEDWLLSLHRVPYQHMLHSGKTVTQTFYDAHFSGAAKAANAVDAWEETHGLVDSVNYNAVHEQLEQAARRAEIWRDSATEWLATASNMPDALSFVGNHSGRVEAESMKLRGYAVSTTQVQGDASAGKYISCSAAQCSASTPFQGEENVYRVEVGYFDDAAASALELRVNGVARAHWSSAVAGPDSAVGGQTAERFVVNGIRLKPQDTVEILVSTRNGGHAPLDFLEITRDPRWN
jgi:hypothetical protein